MSALQGSGISEELLNLCGRASWAAPAEASASSLSGVPGRFSQLAPTIQLITVVTAGSCCLTTLIIARLVGVTSVKIVLKTSSKHHERLGCRVASYSLYVHGNLPPSSHLQKKTMKNAVVIYCLFMQRPSSTQHSLPLPLSVPVPSLLPPLLPSPPPPPSLLSSLSSCPAKQQDELHLAYARNSCLVFLAMKTKHIHSSLHGLGRFHGCYLQAMRDSDLSTCVQQCCTLIGCFVASRDYMPLLMAQLETAADPAAEGGCLAVWASFMQGAGEHYLCLRSCACCMLCCTNAV